MRRFLYHYLVFLTIGLTACSSASAPPPVTQLPAVTIDNTKIIAGQTVYVPAYSHIYMWNQNQTMNLSATLSVRNTDMTNPIIIASVNYHDSDGQLVRQYLDQAIELGSLASTTFVVDREDTSGGFGAAFIVEWVTQTEVSLPVIEAIMINTSGNQGISFVSPGRVIKSRTNDASQQTNL
ncbi:MAG: DUF3124 domain-containing protein [Elainellaceae cyanobacterium]